MRVEVYKDDDNTLQQKNLRTSTLLLGACSENENDACEWRQGGERANAAAEGPGGKIPRGGKGGEETPNP